MPSPRASGRSSPRCSSTRLSPPRGKPLYLWIFGDNVEDALGHVRYLVFYLVCGVAAAVLQTVLNPGSSVPNVGASGRSPESSAATSSSIRAPASSRSSALLPLPARRGAGGDLPALLVSDAVLDGFGGPRQRGAPPEAGAWRGGARGGFVAGVLLVLLSRPRRRPAARYRIL